MVSKAILRDSCYSTHLPQYSAIACHSLNNHRISRPEIGSIKFKSDFSIFENNNVR